MSSKRQSLERLDTILCSHAPGNNDMFYRNAFAAACCLSIGGKPEAANKLLVSLFDYLGWDQRKSYFIAIRESLHDFAFEYRIEINANAELRR